MKQYLFSYSHAGSQWSIEITADCPEDAKERLQRLPYATYDGEVIARVPVALGPFAKLTVLLQNAYRALARN